MDQKKNRGESSISSEGSKEGRKKITHNTFKKRRLFGVERVERQRKNQRGKKAENLKTSYDPQPGPYINPGGGMVVGHHRRSSTPKNWL